MAPKPRTLRRAGVMSRRVEHVTTTLNLLTEEKLVELVRRDEETAEVDGYSSRSSGAADGGRGRPAIRIQDGDDTDSVPLDGPTEAGAFARLEAARERDWTHEAVQQITELIRDIEKLARKLDRRVTVVMKAGDARVGRISSLTAPCLVDGCTNVPVGVGADRLQSGFCPGCWSAFRRWKATHPTSDPGARRRAFVIYRTAYLSAQAAQQQEVKEP